MSIKLAFTVGDPAGVGPEIIAAWLAANREAARDVAVVGPATWLATLDTAADKIAVGMEGFAASPGKPGGEGARVAWAAMERAAAGCRSGEFAGVVTGPVSKAELARIGYPFPGQTEFFAERWGGDPVMAFCGGKLRLRRTLRSALRHDHVTFIEFLGLKDRRVDRGPESHSLARLALLAKRVEMFRPKTKRRPE
jgi:4-hydroxythreonine-4-phosphate dehydrogenase